MFWAWAEDNVNRALLGMTLRTTFGWQIRFPSGAGDQSALDPELADAGQRRRDDAAGCDMADRGRPAGSAPRSTTRCCSRRADDEIDRQAARLAKIMGDASELVLGPGRRCRCDGAEDNDIVRWPDRYEDKRGAVMFDRVMGLLAEVENRGVFVFGEYPGSQIPNPIGPYSS